jgi:RHS repeat-associated protein
MDMRIAKIVYEDKAHTSITSTYYSYDAQGNFNETWILGNKIPSRINPDKKSWVMATYTRTQQNNPGNEGIANRFEDSYTLNDHTLYGSSRFGTETSKTLLTSRFYLASVNAYNLETGYDANGNLVSTSPSGDNTLEHFTYDYTARVVGDKSYELANHLGNVLAVVTDRKVPFTVDGVLVYSADVVSYSDYSPYGVELDGRHGSSGYRYGFQGQEKDDEVKGEGNSWNYKYRMHDPRIGRFFAVDPLAGKYPWYTPYSFSGNKVIDAIELEGLEEYFVNQSNGNVYWNIYGRKYDNQHGGAPHVMFLTLDSDNHRQTITRPLLETDARNLNDGARTSVKIATSISYVSEDVDGPSVESESQDWVRTTNGGGLVGNLGVIGLWPANTIQTNVKNAPSQGGGASETFNVVVPGGGVDASFFASLDFITGSGPLVDGLMNLVLTDNFGNIIFNGPPGRLLNVGMFPGTTSITATITNNNPNVVNYNIQITVPGNSNSATTIEPSSSANLDTNNTNPTNPNTVVTNTGVFVSDPVPKSSSNNPINQLNGGN